MNIAEKAKEKNAHYYKDVRHLEYIDYYTIADLYEITNPAVAHSLKKILCLGKRSGGKSFEQDIIDARDSMNRALERIEEERQGKWSYRALSFIKRLIGVTKCSKQMPPDNHESVIIRSDSDDQRIRC